MNSKLTVVVATYNEEKNIVRCLESVVGLADEIIVVDARSTDQTVLKAKNFTSNIYLIDNNPVFHKNKQYGLSKAKGDWVLILDADETVSAELKNDIKKVLQGQTINIENKIQQKLFKRHFDLLVKRDGEIGSREGAVTAYFIPRLNYFLAGFLKNGGLYPDGVIRLVQNNKAWFPSQSVHEQMRVKGRVGWLSGELLHYSDPDLNRYLQRFNRYTSLTAEKLHQKKIDINFLNTINYCFLVPIKTFIDIYLFHKGYKDKFLGFVWAFFSGMHYLIAYAKLIILYKSK